MFNFITQTTVRKINKYKNIVGRINSEWREMRGISNTHLAEKTNIFKERFSAGESLEDLLPEVFAAAKEAVRQECNIVLFDSQLIGGIVLHEGKVAEMQTGEGKTMVGMLAAYLNSIKGSGVHIVTANEYLAERDERWMRPIYSLLNTSSSVNLKSMNTNQKKRAYFSDIIYSTSSELCFDYLRDGIAMKTNACTQRQLHYVIIDELDSVLIDEAKTPAVISSSDEQECTDLYFTANSIIRAFIKEGTKIHKSEEGGSHAGDYVVDNSRKSSYLTEKGYKQIESLVAKQPLTRDINDLYSSHNVDIMHYINAALRAHVLYKKNIDYVVKSGEVIIVDERTGRLSQGRRWSEGLHQAIEAKERLYINPDNKTSSSITIQNYFRMYEKISGMTGTADSDSFELSRIYNLNVTVIPTNKPVARNDREDLIYINEQDKNNAIVKEIIECFKRGQPVLVGTISIEQSEKISYLLKEKMIPHQVLNAKQNTREALIVEKAGEPGSITIATNMAGRGTDIILGGRRKKESVISIHEKRREVIATGGLHVIGTARQSSRRIDNQLRGRSGRQGDPGSSQFYLSFEDNVLRGVAKDSIKNLAEFFIKSAKIDGHPLISSAMKDSQYRMERMGFDTRKGLMDYDDIIDMQRGFLHSKRIEILTSNSCATLIENAQIEAAQYTVEKIISGNDSIYYIENKLQLDLNIKINMRDCLALEGCRRNLLFLKILSKIRDNRRRCLLVLREETIKKMESTILLSVFDDKSRGYASVMDELTKSIHFHQYTQNDPTRGYRKHSCEILRDIIQSSSYELVSLLSEGYKKVLKKNRS